LNIREYIKTNRILYTISQFNSHSNIYLVGGGVRDLLLHRSVLDIDIVFETLDYKFLDYLTDVFKVESIIKSPFLTWKISIGDIEIDLAHTRGEYYREPGALPETYPVHSIYQDLKRRDFTINSIACILTPNTGDIIDPMDGYHDLREGILRVLKAGSFLEDPTRAFRAIRYKNRFGFIYHPLTEEEFEHAKKLMSRISASRVRNELERISFEENRKEMFREIGLKKLLFHWRDFFNTFREDMLVSLHEYLDFEKDTWFYFLLVYTRDIEALGGCGLLERKERRSLERILALDRIEKEIMPEELHRWFRKFSDDEVLAAGALQGLKKEILRKYLLRRKDVRVLHDAEEIKEMGIPASRLNEILTILEIEKMKGKLRSKREEEQFLRVLKSRHTFLP